MLPHTKQKKWRHDNKFKHDWSLSLKKWGTESFTELFFHFLTQFCSKRFAFVNHRLFWLWFQLLEHQALCITVLHFAISLGHIHPLTPLKYCPVFAVNIRDCTCTQGWDAADDPWAECVSWPISRTHTMSAPLTSILAKRNQCAHLAGLLSGFICFGCIFASCTENVCNHGGPNLHCEGEHSNDQYQFTVWDCRLDVIQWLQLQVATLAVGTWRGKYGVFCLSHVILLCKVLVWGCWRGNTASHKHAICWMSPLSSSWC